MKRNKMYMLSLICITMLCVFGCEDDGGSEAIAIATEAVTQVQYLDTQVAINEITRSTSDAFLLDTGTSKQSTTAKINDCGQRSSEEIDGAITQTIDFGEGCELENGDTVAGIIRITYDMNGNDTGTIISTTLENYKYNDISVSGSSSTVYSLNESSENFMFIAETDFSFTWPDGLTAESESQSETETVFEISSEAFDFYTLIAGNGLTQFNSGDAYSYEITTSLRTEIGCRYVVSGVITNTENSTTRTRDYGNGECDNEATETDGDGNTVIIDLDKPENQENG